MHVLLVVVDYCTCLMAVKIQNSIVVLIIVITI